MSVGHDSAWLKENLTATQTNQPLSLLGYTAETEYICPFALCVSRIRAILTEKRTAGTLTVTIWKNGAAVASPAALTLDASNPQFRDVAVDQSQATQFALGDRLALVFTTDAAWLPVTSDLVAIVSLARPYGP
jgi:hypothetical protein